MEGLKYDELLKALVDASSHLETRQVFEVRRVAFEDLPTPLCQTLSKRLLLISLTWNIDTSLSDVRIGTVQLRIPHPGSEWNSGKPYLLFDVFIVGQDGKAIRSCSGEAEIEDIERADEIVTKFVNKKIEKIEKEIDQRLVEIGMLSNAAESLRETLQDVIVWAK